MLGENLIAKVKGREILDSRGNPTVLAEVVLCDGSVGVGIAPSGASTGVFEAVELRDEGSGRYGGKGVERAVNNINTVIFERLKGENPYNQRMIDNILIELDGTKNKSNLGANAILAVSMAVARAASNSLECVTGKSNNLYSYIGGISGDIIPMPMMNIVNGGAHAANNIDVQEFMIVPVGAKSFKEGLRWCTEVYHKLQSLFKANGMSVGVGDEGGFAPDISLEISGDNAKEKVENALKVTEKAIDFIKNAIELCGYSFKKGGDFNISLDVAASEWKSENASEYYLPKAKIRLTSDEMILMWSKLIEKYPVFSIEDPLDEEDYNGWIKITELLGSKVTLVGDDLFVTNPERLMEGIEKKMANAILIKPNQIGTLTETIEAVRIAKRNGYRTIMSHRSGETEDTIIADLAVGLNTGYIKTGAPCRSERVAKYNRLLEIEEKMS